MKSIIACLKLYNDKNHHTNGNSNSQPADVDNSVIPVTDQTSECGFEIIFKHAYNVYSVRNDLTGFVKAAFIACVLIVKKAINTAIIAAMINTHQ